MHHLEGAVPVPMDPDQLWREVGPFQRIADWHPFIVSTTGGGEEPGALREAVTWDGEKQVERLLEIDDVQRFYRYAMETTWLPVERCVGEFRVEPADGNASVIRWSAEFDLSEDMPADAIDFVRAFLESGLENLERRFGPPTEDGDG